MDFPIVLNENLFPVQAFFNAMPARSLVRTLVAFCSGVGAGFNDATCEFPDELDEGEIRFEGVRFEVLDESVIISKSEFSIFYLKSVLATLTNILTNGIRFVS